MRRISLDEIPWAAAQLCGQIAGEPVTQVCYIEEGGRLLGLAVAAELKCRATPVVARRAGSRLKQALRPLIARLPARLTHLLRAIELRSGVHQRASGRSVQLDPRAVDTRGRIAVVDDAVDTGHSLQAAVDALLAVGANRTRIVTMAVAVTRPDVIVRPDIALFDEQVLFPWSPGAPDHAEYRRIIAAQNAARARSP